MAFHVQSLATVTVIDPTPPPDPNGVAGDEAFAWHRGVVEGLVTLVDVEVELPHAMTDRN